MPRKPFLTACRMCAGLGGVVANCETSGAAFPRAEELRA